MDKVFINGIKAYGRHGVLGIEKKIIQLFVIDITVAVCLEKAGSSDLLKDTVDYSDINKIVITTVENESFSLIEKLASEIADKILCSYSFADRVTVLIKKPYAPIMGSFNEAGIEITRSRKKDNE